MVHRVLVGKLDPRAQRGLKPTADPVSVLRRHLIDLTITVVIDSVIQAAFDGPGVDGGYFVVAVIDGGSEPVAVHIGDVCANDIDRAVAVDAVTAEIGSAWVDHRIAVVAIRAKGDRVDAVSITILGAAGEIGPVAVLVDTVFTMLEKTDTHRGVTVIAVVGTLDAVAVEVVRATLIDLSVAVVIDAIVAVVSNERVVRIGAVAFENRWIYIGIRVVAVGTATLESLVHCPIFIAVLVARHVAIEAGGDVYVAVVIDFVAAYFLGSRVNGRIVVITVDVRGRTVPVPVLTASVSVPAVLIVTIATCFDDEGVPLVVGVEVRGAMFGELVAVARVAVLHREPSSARAGPVATPVVSRLVITEGVDAFGESVTVFIELGDESPKENIGAVDIAIDDFADIGDQPIIGIVEWSADEVDGVVAFVRKSNIYTNRISADSDEIAVLVGVDGEVFLIVNSNCFIGMVLLYVHLEVGHHRTSTDIEQYPSRLVITAGRQKEPDGDRGHGDAQNDTLVHSTIISTPPRAPARGVIPLHHHGLPAHFCRLTLPVFHSHDKVTAR